MRIAVLLPSLKKKGPVILALDVLKGLYDRVDKIDIFYFSNCSDPYLIPEQYNISVKKISFFKPLKFADYDIIHSHSFKPDFYTYVFRQHLSPIVITTIHNYVESELTYTYNRVISLIFSKLWLLSMENKNGIVFLSNNMRNYYLSKKINFLSSIVINNGRTIQDINYQDIDIEILNFLNKKKANYKIIGCCGFLNKRKGFEDVIRFLAIDFDLYAIFIGEGPERTNLVSLAKELNVENRCSFLGHQDNPLPIMKNFDVFAMCSFSEGFPLVMLEAGSLGVPIICVNNPLFNELFSNDEVVFYNRDNFDSIKLAINQIKENGDYYSNNIKTVMTSKYSSEKMVCNYFNYFKTLLNAEFN